MFFGFFTATVIIIYILAANLRRLRDQKAWTLKPNCLMTRYPILFLTGRRSLFYFMNYWNRIPDFLAQHGFQVMVLSLNWNNTRIRIHQMKSALSQLEKRREKIHVFLDESSLSELIRIIDSRDYQCIESITLMGSGLKMPPYRLKVPLHSLSLKRNPSSPPLFWWIHSLLTFQLEAGSLNQKPENKLAQLGWQLSEENGYRILERVQELAESDLLNGPRFNNLTS